LKVGDNFYNIMKVNKVSLSLMKLLTVGYQVTSNT